MVDCKGCLKSSMIVHFLVIMFGAGAWIAVNGVWVELPVIVSSAPESWNLPSYLTIIAQVANVGPVLVTLMQLFCPKYFHQNAMIYSILLIGTLSCLLLVFFWDVTVVIAGKESSLALFVLWFALAFVDCTSSVTFLPFMRVLQTIFLTTYFIGEGLSGFLPSMFALIQGVQEVQCQNVSIFNETTNSTSFHIQTHYTNPRYSANVFFLLLCIMMLACSISFVLLNYLGIARKFYAATAFVAEGSSNTVGGTGFYKGFEMENSGENTPINGSLENEQQPSAVVQNSTTGLVVEETDQNLLSKLDYIYLLSIICFTNAISNGVLPAVSSYSSLPYGSMVYHLSACLGNMANPVACLIAVFLPVHSFVAIGVFTLLSAGVGSYLMLLAVQSPCPILVNEDIGKALMILSQIAFVGIISFIKVSVAQIFRMRGHEKSLVWYGAVVQAGSLTGALIMFPLVNVSQLFASGDPCTTVCL